MGAFSQSDLNSWMIFGLLFWSIPLSFIISVIFGFLGRQYVLKAILVVLLLYLIGNGIFLVFGFLAQVHTLDIFSLVKVALLFTGQWVITIIVGMGIGAGISKVFNK